VDLTIGLVNNMPDAALQATERQFMRLLRHAAGDIRIDLHCFSLPSVHRSQTAKWRIDRQYTDIADLGRLHIDGLIVTGAEPNAASLPEEPFWQDLSNLIDWAQTNTRSTIWSCLAAHAAVLHLDGIERMRLDTKCSGIYDCDRVTDSWLTRGLPSPLKISHSRLNELRADDLAARGYQLLTQSREAGVDIFVKELRSHFVFFQGHPEYDALSAGAGISARHLPLSRRPARRLSGRARRLFRYRDENKLTVFRRRASVERRPALSAELPDRKPSPGYRRRRRGNDDFQQLARISGRRSPSGAAVDRIANRALTGARQRVPRYA